MIDSSYCLVMARYNAWQNTQVKQAMSGMSAAALTQDRKSFFGSILGTANHILWADLLWMSRFADGTPPDGGIETSPAFCGSLQEWELQRFRADSRIMQWAESLSSIDLAGELTYRSVARGDLVTIRRKLAVMHMFNHQTHHRGQIHAMLTAAGSKAPVSDLAFMPEEGPWL